MAVPPTIPTSFVPHPGGSEARRATTDLTGAFGFFTYFVFAIIVLSAFAVFGYDRLLAAQQKSKDEQLAAAEAQLDLATVNGIVRLRDRLASGQTLLNKHVALSNFFHALEKALPQNMRLSQMHISMDSNGKVMLTATGNAKSFNTLAQASDAFAADMRIKDVIFSDITVTASNSVSFALTATLDPELIAFAPATPAVEEADITTP
ncbi:MAG TPA: hypothetical protein VM103_00200 [Candidatus Paceibacterota bacterium]|nr:hypothetical protein [Candidatus Paceibacterota bacterium]